MKSFLLTYVHVVVVAVVGVVVSTLPFLSWPHIVVVVHIGVHKYN